MESLVHRGANGGVAINKVRLIAKHPDREIDIHSVDNHGIIYILLITAGRVTPTTAGKLFISHANMNIIEIIRLSIHYYR